MYLVKKIWYDLNQQFLVKTFLTAWVAYQFEKLNSSKKQVYQLTRCGSIDSSGSKGVDLWLMQLHRQQLSPKKGNDTESVTIAFFEMQQNES